VIAKKEGGGEIRNQISWSSGDEEIRSEKSSVWGSRGGLEGP